MAWAIEFSPEAARELNRLDAQHARKILKFLNDRVSKIDNPRSISSALHGERFGEFWKYRVDDYRLICRIEEERLLILVLRIGHRREIYR